MRHTGHERKRQRGTEQRGRDGRTETEGKRTERKRQREETDGRFRG